MSRGLNAYRQGRHDAALAEFETASSLAPDRPEPRYNAAATLFQLGRYPEARDHYQEAHDRAGPALRTKIDFAMGNAALVLGEIAEAISHYDDCIASSAPGRDLDAVREDATINRQFAIEQAKSPGSEPPSNPQDGNGTSQAEQSAGLKPGAGRADDSTGSPGPSAGRDDGPNSDPSDPDGGRTGGSGGSQANPPGGRSPSDRLDDAIDQIRDARRWRLPDQELSDGQGGLRMISRTGDRTVWIKIVLAVTAGSASFGWSAGSAGEPDSLRVRVELETTSLFVGQGAELVVGVVGEENRPRSSRSRSKVPMSGRSERASNRSRRRESALLCHSRTCICDGFEWCLAGREPGDPADRGSPR